MNVARNRFKYFKNRALVTSIWASNDLQSTSWSKRSKKFFRASGFEVRAISLIKVLDWHKKASIFSSSKVIGFFTSHGVNMDSDCCQSFVRSLEIDRLLQDGKDLSNKALNFRYKFSRQLLYGSQEGFDFLLLWRRILLLHQ